MVAFGLLDLAGAFLVFGLDLPLTVCSRITESRLNSRSHIRPVREPFTRPSVAFLMAGQPSPAFRIL